MSSPNLPPPAVSVDDLKSRLIAHDTAPAPEMRPMGRQMPAALLAEAERFQADLVEANAPEERIDLGPLPPAAKSKVDEAKKKQLRNIPGLRFVDEALQKAIEGRCTEMDFSDLVMTGRVQQVVPIIPKKLEVGFQSLLGTESYWIERTALSEVEPMQGAWSAYARLALSVTSINGKAVEPHLGRDGKVDDEAVERKQAALMKMPDSMVRLLLVNLNWFGARVEDLYDRDFEALKNG